MDPAPQIEELHARLRALEAFRQDVEQSTDTEIGANIRLFSRVQALEVVMLEVLEHLGVDSNKAKARLEHLQRTFHESHLKQAEDLNPGFAGSIDDRDIDEVPSGDRVDRLFPPSNS